MTVFIVLLSLLIVAAIISLPGTLIVKIGSRAMCHFTTSFHIAYTAVVSSYVTYFIIQVVFSMFFRIKLHIGVLLGIMYLLHAWTYFRRVRSDEGKVLSIPAALLIALFQVLIIGLAAVLIFKVPCGMTYHPGGT